jgi:endonuclease YncB( thermonuclease family)
MAKEVVKSYERLMVSGHAVMHQKAKALVFPNAWPSGLLVGALIVLWSSPPALAQSVSGSVISIGDGDTIRMQTGTSVKTVRLACIDTPETAQSPYGAAARQQLQSLLPIGSSIQVKVKATDRYGRSVGEITRNGRNINQALVGSGAAFVYWQYIQGCDRQTYSRLENDARLKAAGVWSVKGGITRPWDYRSGRSGSSGSTSTATPSSQGSSSRKYRCSDFTTAAQAQTALNQGHAYLDKDGDGRACESLR